MWGNGPGLRLAHRNSPLGAICVQIGLKLKKRVSLKFPNEKVSSMLLLTSISETPAPGQLPAGISRIITTPQRQSPVHRMGGSYSYSYDSRRRDWGVHMPASGLCAGGPSRRRAPGSAPGPAAPSAPPAAPSGCPWPPSPSSATHLPAPHQTHPPMPSITRASTPHTIEIALLPDCCLSAHNDEQGCHFRYVMTGSTGQPAICEDSHSYHSGRVVGLSSAQLRVRQREAE